MKRLLVCVLLATAMVIAGIQYCPVPWAPALLAASALFACVAWQRKQVSAKIIMANLAAALFALAAFEAFLGYQDARGDGTWMEGTITDGFTHPDDVLGYAPDPGRRVTARKIYGNTVIYDVAYTIGSDGLCVTPSPVAPIVEGCVVFFGDSVSFGEGVNDDEAFPFLVAGKTAGADAVHNFAFSGYGPHQMLAALQAGRVEEVATCKPTHFFYLGILEHIARVAGRASWDRHGPRFQLDADGTPRRDGNFDSATALRGAAAAFAEFDAAMRRYLTWQRLVAGSSIGSNSDLDLYVAIVLESVRLTHQRFPGSTFQVLLWDGVDDPRIDAIERRAAAAGASVHRLTSVIPDFAANADRYLLGPRDGHPNPLMHERIAAYIASSLARR